MEPNPNPVKPETWVDRVYEPTKSDISGFNPKHGMWFHNGQHLKPFERLGFLVIFLFFLSFDIPLFSHTIHLFREHDNEAYGFGILAIFLAIPSLWGIKNALSFRRQRKNH
jgi:hypothetical protein